MSLQYGILGLLNYHDSTGYDLTKRFEYSLNNFWHAQSSQIYRELSRMEAADWVTSRSIIQNGRPNKRLYSITETGRSALAQWLCDATLDLGNNHNAMLVRVFFGADDPQSTLRLIQSCRDVLKKVLAAYNEPMRANIKSYAESIGGGEEKRKYWDMTLDYGVSQAGAMLAWTERCIEKIEKELVE